MDESTDTDDWLVTVARPGVAAGSRSLVACFGVYILCLVSGALAPLPPGCPVGDAFLLHALLP